MSVMERRLQLLLDQARYDRVAAEAERTGRSVASVIREAIDYRFPDDGDQARAAAVRRLLALTAEPDPGPAESTEELKAAYDQYLNEKFDRL